MRLVPASETSQATARADVGMLTITLWDSNKMIISPPSQFSKCFYGMEMRRILIIHGTSLPFAEPFYIRDRQ